MVTVSCVGRRGIASPRLPTVSCQSAFTLVLIALGEEGL